MDQYRTNLIIRVAKLHYELGMSQIEIAKQEHLSKSTVSRLIKLANDLGMVKITIVEPKHSYADLENEWIAKFHLKKVTILPDIVENKDILLQDICKAAAEDLPRYVDDHSVLGLAWGNTLSKLRTVLSNVKRKGVSVIQLNGGVSKVLYDVGSTNMVRAFVDAYQADGYLLPAPALVDNKEIAETIKSDSSLKETLDLAKHCQTAVYSIGTIGYNTTLYQMGYFNEEAYKKISQKAVGDVCSHFIDENGNLANEELDDRVIAAPLSLIRTIPNKVVIASGTQKAKAILAAIHGQLVDYLYIDQPTAAKVLQLSNQHERNI